MSPAEKARTVTQLTQGVQTLALAGLRRRYPEADAKELRLRLASLWLSRDMMVKAFQWDPQEHGV